MRQPSWLVTCAWRGEINTCIEDSLTHVATWVCKEVLRPCHGQMAEGLLKDVAGCSDMNTTLTHITCSFIGYIFLVKECSDLAWIREVHSSQSTLWEAAGEGNSIVRWRPRGSVASPRTHPTHHVPSVRSLGIWTHAISRIPASNLKSLKKADWIRYEVSCRVKLSDRAFIYCVSGWRPGPTVWRRKP